jgi:signal transduction histidine kinase/HPt (histidine-containing phosphotransfer) domain-containing protein/ActR/RegA family two-component response regulator
MKIDLENINPFAGGVRRGLRLLWPRRLSAQLVLLFSLMLAVSMTFFTYLMLNEVVGKITSDMKMQAGVLANDISATGANFLLERDYTSIEQMLLRSIDFPGVIAIQVCDSQGKLIGDVSRSADKPPEVHYGEPPLRVPADAAASMQFDKTRMLVWQPVILGDLLGWVRITYNLQDILDAQTKFWRTTAINGVAIILLALVFLGGLIRRPLLSVERYTEFSGKLVEMHGKTMPVDHFSIELQRLGEALNDASVRLEEQGRAVTNSMAELEKLAAFPENNPNIVLSMDAGANVTYMNPHGLQMLADLKLGPDDIGKLLPHEYRAIVERCLADGSTTRAVEVEFSRHILLWTFAPLLSQRIVQAYAQDITEKREAEVYSRNVLMEKQAAEAANQAKSIFLANMSHEIRTPLNGVMGFLKLLSKTGLTETQRDYLNTTEVSAKMLLTVINDILDFSKIEAGKISIEQIEIDFKELLEDGISLYAANAESKGLDLHFVFDEEVPARLLGDPARISQVLSNLLGNAIKFTQHGEILVQADLKEENDADVLVEVSVKDSGIGISAEALERLFRPFSQADASTTRKYGGTGLGLVISKMLVELMGGKVSVDSLEGQGARFAFSLRLSKQTTGHAFMPPGQAALPEHHAFKLRPGKAGEKLRVLIVDDSEINRKLAKILIEQLGGTADLAENGLLAVEACKKNKYDLIMMDVHMPVMDGVEATIRIRESDRGGKHHTPIFALTANAMSGDRERYLEAGMDEYLSKPINEASFRSILQKFGLLVSASGGETTRNAVIPSDADNQTSPPVFDPQMGVKLAFGNRQTWRTVLGMLYDDLPEYSAGLIAAATSGDMEKLRQTAHKLAGASSYCGTPALHHQAKKVENLAKNGDMNLTAEAVDALLQQIERLLALKINGNPPNGEGPIY